MPSKIGYLRSCNRHCRTLTACPERNFGPCSSAAARGQRPEVQVFLSPFSPLEMLTVNKEGETCGQPRGRASPRLCHEYARLHYHYQTVALMTARDPESRVGGKRAARCSREEARSDLFIHPGARRDLILSLGCQRQDSRSPTLTSSAS